MALDVADPELIGMVAMRLAIDAVAGRGHAGNAPVPRAARDALDASAARGSSTA